jgi:hypothetical protein
MASRLNIQHSLNSFSPPVLERCRAGLPPGHGRLTRLAAAGNQSVLHMPRTGDQTKRVQRANLSAERER